MKPKYKSSKNSKDVIQRSKDWYTGLDFHDKESVDKKVKRYIEYVSNRSNTQASKNMGIELIFSLLKCGTIKTLS